MVSYRHRCESLEWVLCALQGRLRGQGFSEITFEVAPRDTQLRWLTHPGELPAYPCRQLPCDAGAYTVNDAYLAELAMIYALCANRRELWQLSAEREFECELEEDAYRDLTSRLV